MEQRNEEYIEIDLLELLSILRGKALTIALSALAFGLAGFLLAFCVIPPKYQAGALLYVNNSSFSVGSTSISLSDLSASQTLVDTYIAILMTRLTLNEVIEQAELGYDYEELKEMIEAEGVNGTEIFEITVTSKDPLESKRIANTIVDVLPDKIAQIVDGSSVRTVDFAVSPEERSSPSVVLFTALGAVAGVALSCGAIVLLHLLDEQIRSEAYLLQTYRLPVLAAIPDMASHQTGKGYGSYYAAGKRRCEP